MDYATISLCLGGSIFSEEYRGGLDEIRSRCAESSSRASSANDAPSAMLLQAVYCIYTGSLSEAQHLLDDLLAQHDSSLQFLARCHIYAFLLETVRRLPPVLRFCSTLGNPAIRLLDAERDIEGKMAKLHDISRHLSNSAMETVEYILVGNLLTFNTTLHMLFRKHSKHPSTFAPNEPVSLNPFTDGLRDLAASLNLGITEMYLQRLTVEMHFARGLDEWKNLLKRLQDSYEASMDLNGMANCYLIEADSIVSLPFTSPLAMNLITLTKAGGWSDSTWDATQSAFPLQSKELADELYDRAFFLFDAGASPRGKAAVLLRRGCIHHAVAISPETNTKNAATASALKQAASCFAEAAGLFEGDIVNSMLVACHRLLLAISARHMQNTSNLSLGPDHGLPADVLLAAADLGRRARETGNAGAAQFMGSLMLMFGRWRFMSSQRDVQTALVCCLCARAFFEAAEDPYLQLQSLIAHASILHESGDHERAQVTIENGRETQGLLGRALESIQKASFSELPERPGTGICALRSNTVQAFDTIACRIYQTTGNSVLFEDWRRQRDQLAQLGSYEKDMEDLIDRLGELSPPSAKPVPPAIEIVPKLLSIEALQCEYNKKMVLVYEALDNADIEAWKSHLRGFLSACDTTEVAEPYSSPDIAAFFKLVALSQLGALDGARAVLPVALGEYLTSSEARDQFNRGFEALAPPDMVVERSKQKFHEADGALARCVLAQDWKVGARVLSTAESLCPKQFEKPQTIPPVPGSWMTLTFVGMICEHNKQLQKALEWYLEALERLEGLRKAVDIEVRRGCHSSIYSGELFAGLARVCISMHQSGGLEQGPSGYGKSPSDFGLSGRSWLEQALLFIERGKARTLLDYVVTKDNGDPKKLEEWAQLAYEGRLLIGLETQQGQRAKALSPDEVARKLGRVPGGMRSREDVQRALSHLDAEQLALGAMLGLAEPEPDAIPLFSCIPRDTVVFEISSSRQGLVLRTLVLNFSKIVRSKSTNAESAERLSEIASAISKELLEPLKHTMSDKDVVAFAPSHVMQLFPCTALILEEQPLFLSKIVYHIPSLSLFRHLSQRGELDLSPGQKTISVLASSKAAGSDMKPGRELVERAIPMIGPEAVMIADAFTTDAADLASCTTDELRSILRESNIVYLTTHGKSMDSSPWQAFLDTEPPFRVLDLAALATTHARLIVFGCCWTGAGSANAGNDVVGFAHATLASGARAYLGGLWQVHELVSLVLMVYFFRELAADGSIHLASALRNAQIAMYHMDNSSVVVLIDETLELWRQKINREDTKFLQRFKHSESYLVMLRKRFSREAEELDFKHPTMWAPFILTGWGGAGPGKKDDSKTLKF
ncbi:CHAT domain-containing protein [Lasiosphaeria hispida]|uniref:CHAT domain-containing protein n=1 Tax=Lasiosphaeria hispida TaxID=260671 RepID=A0AAJ0M7M5_9PEZI|nr:CHAT domain-containing protein [Lasiosphaeria hispida]